MSQVFVRTSHIHHISSQFSHPFPLSYLYPTITRTTSLMNSKAPSSSTVQDSNTPLSHIGAWSDSVLQSPDTIFPETFHASSAYPNIEKARYKAKCSLRNISNETKHCLQAYLQNEPRNPHKCDTYTQVLTPMQRWLGETVGKGPWRAIEGTSKICPAQSTNIPVTHRGAAFSDTAATYGRSSSGEQDAETERGF